MGRYRPFGLDPGHIVRPRGEVRGAEEPLGPQGLVRRPTEDADVLLRGYTDRNGYFLFLPDREGTWKVEADVDVGKAMKVENTERPEDLALW